MGMVRAGFEMEGQWAAAQLWKRSCGRRVGRGQDERVKLQDDGLHHCCSSAG